MKHHAMTEFKKGYLNINSFIVITFRLTNKAKLVVVVNQKCLSISVPPVSTLRQLTKIRFTVINAGSAGKLNWKYVLSLCNE